MQRDSVQACNVFMDSLMRYVHSYARISRIMNKANENLSIPERGGWFQFHLGVINGKKKYGRTCLYSEMVRIREKNGTVPL